MGGKIELIQKQLENLGYKHKLQPECVPLVEKLLEDLTVTTVNLEKYMKISQQALEEIDTLKLGSEPYKCDNAKLIQECNDLHLAFIHFKEQHEKIQSDLRTQIKRLQSELDDCVSEKRTLITQIKQQERNLTDKRDRKSTKLEDRNSLKETKVAMSLSNEKINQLNKELKQLREEQLQLVQENYTLQNKVSSRDEEIKRINSLLEGGRPYKSASKDCCYKNVDAKITVLQEEINSLRKDKNQLQNHLKETLAKQHEAMRRAVHLAERNKQLQKEMRDIDAMALDVEAECNNAVKDNAEKVVRLQDRMNESLTLMQKLERENAKLKQTKVQLSADLEALRLEKVHLEKQLEGEVEDKKRLTDKINNFTRIENDLNLEIDRLTKLSTQQKRKIIELESMGAPEKDDPIELISEKTQTQQATKARPIKKDHKKGNKKTKASTVKKSSISENYLETPKPKCCCENGTCVKHLKELLDKEIEYRQASDLLSMETLKQEKEYFKKEYQNLLEQVRNVPTEDKSGSCSDLLQKLEEKERCIRKLESEMQLLMRDKQTGMSKESVIDLTDGTCCNPLCKRKERELDIIKNDLKHIEMENNTLKSKLQALNETTLFNEERMKKAFQDMEEHIRKLENERRDLVQTELTQRSNITVLEEEYKTVREKLKLMESELNNQKASYHQLKLLHEQTDRALSDAQNQVIRAQTDLATYQSKATDTSREKAVFDKEVARLNSDVQIMRNQLNKLDKEKDELLNLLDEKTEKIANLEDQLRSKAGITDKLEIELKDLRRKLSKSTDETSSQDHLLRTKQQELMILERNYEKERELKEAALLENKRLQNDLASVARDCREARNELEIAKRQVDDLKRQLQQYVSEVKRTEDLISQKEIERTELLDQFRSLSQEASVLENTNHTLENEATQSKIQLSVALDHSTELEKRIENQETIIQSYERQIGDLTSQVASLEIQLKRVNADRGTFDSELKQMRDLCVKLDNEKEDLRRKLYAKEDYQSQVSKNADSLQEEKASLQKALAKEQNNLENVEKLLSDARQEIIDQRLINQDLQNEVDRLRHDLDALREKLGESSENRGTKKKSKNKRSTEKICCPCHDLYFTVLRKIKVAGEIEFANKNQTSDSNKTSSDPKSSETVQPNPEKLSSERNSTPKSPEFSPEADPDSTKSSKCIYRNSTPKSPEADPEPTGTKSSKSICRNSTPTSPEFSPEADPEPKGTKSSKRICRNSTPISPESPSEANPEPKETKSSKYICRNSTPISPDSSPQADPEPKETKSSKYICRNSTPKFPEFSPETDPKQKETKSSKRICRNSTPKSPESSPEADPEPKETKSSKRICRNSTPKSPESFPEADPKPKETKSSKCICRNSTPKFPEAGPEQKETKPSKYIYKNSTPKSPEGDLEPKETKSSKCICIKKSWCGVHINSKNGKKTEGWDICKVTNRTCKKLYVNSN